MIAKEIGNDQLAYDISYWIVCASTLFLFIFQHLNNFKNTYTENSYLMPISPFHKYYLMTLWRV